MSPLNATLTLIEVTNHTGPVTDDLHFDMAGAYEELFNVYVPAAEGLQGFRLTTGVCLFDLLRVTHRPHAPSTTTRHGLDHDGLTIVQGREKLTDLRKACRTRGAKKHGHPTAFSQCSCLSLVAKEFEDLCPWSNKGDSFLITAARKRSVLTEKSVPWVEGITVSFLGHCQNLLNVEV